MNRLVAFALALLLHGCTTVPTKSVTVKLPARVPKNANALSIEHPEVLKAFAIIEKVLLDASLTRLPGDMTPQPDGSLIEYKDDGIRRCTVGITKNQVWILFSERGHRGSSERVLKLTRVLRNE